MTNIELKVAGQIYSGWTELAFEAGLEQLAGSFTLNLTEHWPGTEAGRPVRPGQACVLLIDGEAVLTGWIDEVAPSFDASQRSLTVSGRDRTADLVDCSAIHGSGQWKGASLARIARDLCKPFSIPVVIDPAVQTLADKVFPTWSIEDGESVFDCLERAARLHTVMLTTRGDGALFITRPGFEKAQTALVEGQNILAAEGRFSWAERYSEYHIKGQSRKSHDDKGKSIDAVINRYRPLIVLAEDQAHDATATERADWEKNRPRRAQQPRHGDRGRLAAGRRLAAVATQPARTACFQPLTRQW